MHIWFDIALALFAARITWGLLAWAAGSPLGPRRAVRGMRTSRMDRARRLLLTSLGLRDVGTRRFERRPATLLR